MPVREGIIEALDRLASESTVPVRAVAPTRVSIAEAVAAAGGTAAYAKLVGRSQRTVQRWITTAAEKRAPSVKSAAAITTARRALTKGEFSKRLRTSTVTVSTTGLSYKVSKRWHLGDLPDISISGRSLADLLEDKPDSEQRFWNQVFSAWPPNGAPHPLDVNEFDTLDFAFGGEEPEEEEESEEE